MAQIYGELLRAQLHLSAADLTPTATGLMYFNTTSSTFKWYTGSVWVTAADTSTAQTFTNKTIDGNSNTLTVLAATQLSGAAPIANGGTGQTSQTAAFDALSPTTTKGDLIVSNGTDNIRLAVGTNGQVLTADSAEASGVKWGTSSATVDPTALSNADATKLGLKQYFHGTTYNGGNAPTVTLTAGGGTLNNVQIGEFIPYQMQDSSWRLRFNVTCELSATARTTATLNVAGVTSRTFSQGIAGFFLASGADAAYAFWQSSSGNMIVLATGSVTADEIVYSGDIKLASKPTWAF